MPKSTTIKYPPGPKYKARPFKLVREFLHDPIKSIQEISDKYGDIAYFKLGRQRIYLLNNPDYIEKVLVYGHRNFTKGKKLQVAKAILGEGLVTSEGELHTRQRRIIQPIFNPKQVSVYGKIVTEFATNMELRWKNGETLDISKEMMQLTLGIICKSVLNYDVASEAEGYGKALTTLINHGKRLKSPLGHVLNKIPILPSVKGAREAKEKLDELVYGLVQQRREAIQSKVKSYDDLLSHLLQAQDNWKSSSRATTASNFDSSSLGMSDKQARDEVMTIFLAGHETTANALTWTFYLLSRNPTIDAKLLEELKSVIGDTGTVTVEDIPKLYLLT